MGFPDDVANEFVPRSPVSPFGLELENILEDHGVSWQSVDEMLALEVETSQHCTGTTDARLSFCGISPLQLAASLFSQQLLDPTHRVWTERADTDIDINDIQPLAVAGSIHIKLQSERYPGPAPFQLPDPLQPACSLTDLLTAVATLHAKRQPHSAPLLHSA